MQGLLPDNHALRREELVHWLTEQEASAAWVTAGPSFYYLTGWHSPYALERLTGLLLTADGRCALLVPALDAEAAAVAGLPLHTWRDGEDPVAALAELARSLGVAGGCWAVEKQRLSWAAGEHLCRVVGVHEFTDVGGWLAGRRAVKDPDELMLIERAASVLGPALDRIRQAIRPGLTERRLAAEVRQALLDAGAEGVAFEPIVLTGPNSALPHGVPGNREVQPGDVVLVDCGATLGGYCSDITRTFVAGRFDPQAYEVYTVVKGALQAAIAAIRPGARPGDVDAAARRVIEEAGYGPYFVHRVGHGLGIEVHEEPWLHAGYQRPLEPGMVLTVEPGVYLPGRFGIRIEEMVAVTEDGHRLLTRWSTQIHEMEVLAR